MVRRRVNTQRVASVIVYSFNITALLQCRCLQFCFSACMCGIFCCVCVFVCLLQVWLMRIFGCIMLMIVIV